MVLAATMTSVSESSAKHRRGMAGVENYELSFEHVPDLSGLHLRCAGGRLYSPTRIRRRLAVYQSACSTYLPPPCLYVYCSSLHRLLLPICNYSRIRSMRCRSRYLRQRHCARDADRFVHDNISGSFTFCNASASSRPVWKSKFYGAFMLNHRVGLHAIDATPARWRGGDGSPPLDRARTAASSPRNDLVKNCRVHPTHWLISTQSSTTNRNTCCKSFVS